jgi:hypothetical protein
MAMSPRSYSDLLVYMPQHSRKNQAYMQSHPQQKPHRWDETLNTTPQIIWAYSWCCAGPCLPTTWSQLRSPSLIFLQVGCCAALHSLGSGANTQKHPFLFMPWCLRIFSFFIG